MLNNQKINCTIQFRWAANLLTIAIIALSLALPYQITSLILGENALNESSTQLFEKVVEHHGLTVLPLELSHCIAAAELPPIHNDPCDRFIIAAAKLGKFTVVTSDERFHEYGVKVIS